MYTIIETIADVLCCFLSVLILFLWILSTQVIHSSLMTPYHNCILSLPFSSVNVFDSKTNCFSVYSAKRKNQINEYSKLSLCIFPLLFHHVTTTLRKELKKTYSLWKTFVLVDIGVQYGSWMGLVCFIYMIFLMKHELFMIIIIFSLSKSVDIVYFIWVNSFRKLLNSACWCWKITRYFELYSYNIHL